MEEIRTFRAGTLQEALQLVRHSLGPDAAVLTTRNLKVNRLGLFPKTMIEVEASVDRPTSPRFSDEPVEVIDTASEPSHTEQSKDHETVAVMTVAQPSTSTRTVARRRTGATDATNTRLQTNVDVEPNNDAARLKQPQQPTNDEVVSNRLSVPRRSDSPAEVSPPPGTSSRLANVGGAGGLASPTAGTITVLTEMLENGVEPTYAKALLAATTQQMPADFSNDPWKIRQQLQRVIMGRLECVGPIQPTAGERKVVAFVGPTGSGKTSTLAKVAAGVRFDTGCQVGLITVDTFRLGAVDQLLQYAELMSAPLEVVSSTDQISGALERMLDCDLIMLDTAGRSHRDADQLHVLKELIQAAQPDSVQLAVSATCARAQVYDTIAKFSDVGATQLLITKLDEAVAFGEWMSVLCESTLPVSYLTTGQHVPQDILAATPRRLAGMLLGTSPHEPARPAMSVD